MKRFLVLALASLLLAGPSFADTPKPATAVKPAAKTPAAAAVAKVDKAEPKKADAAKPADAKKAEPKAAAKPAAKAPEMGIVKTLISEGVKLLFALLLALLSGLIVVLGRKYKFEAEATKVNEILKQAAGYGEQKALKGFKLDGTHTEGAQKMKDALGKALELAEGAGLKKKGQDYWEGLLEGWLGVQKLEAEKAAAAKPAEPA